MQVSKQKAINVSFSLKKTGNEFWPRPKVTLWKEGMAFRKFGDLNYKPEYTFKSHYNKSYYQKIWGPLKYTTECTFKHHYK